MSDQEASGRALPYSQAIEVLDEHAKRLLIEQMRKQKVTYKQLSERLAVLGVHESPDTLNRKVNRKKFQASFLVACLIALDVRQLDLTSVSVSHTSRETRLAQKLASELERQGRRR